MLLDNDVAAEMHGKKTLTYSMEFCGSKKRGLADTGRGTVLFEICDKECWMDKMQP